MTSISLSFTLRRLTVIMAAASVTIFAGCAHRPDTGPDSPQLQFSPPSAGMPLATGAAKSDERNPMAGLTAEAMAGATAAPEPDTEAAVADPLRPGMQIDLNDAIAATDLWARVRHGFAMPDLDNDLVRESERFYAQRPEYVARMTERGGRYLYHVVEEVEKRGMPTELALLPFTESAFNPQAMSVAKASGMWQFIPSTGKNFALKQNLFRDDRRDVLASTRAALDYLGRLHDMFGDWHLALAAYNWGEGSVQRAIARNQKLGLPTDYASLSMPNETRGYVPKLQAVKNIVLHPEQYGLSLPPLQNHPYFLSVAIERDIDVDLAARFAGVPVEEFKQLNPQMNKPVILAAGTEQVLLPYDNASRFVHNMQSHRGPMATWTAWVAPRTVRAADAARQVGMSETQLREVNHIPPRMLVKAGSTLLVLRGQNRTADVPEHVADNAVMALAPDLPPMRKVTLRAGRRGDSVVAVAGRFRAKVAQVAQWNRVNTNARFQPGATIVVYVAQKAATPKAQRATRGAHSTRVAQAAPASAKAVRTSVSSRSHAGTKSTVRSTVRVAQR